MKSTKIKVLIVAIVTFFLLLAGAIYYASTKLNPEEIRRLTIEETSKIFPNSKVSLETIDVKLGLNFKVYLRQMRIDYLENGSNPIPMLSLNELQVKVPFWAIITGGGVVEFKLENPEITYVEFEQGNNWTKSMGESKKNEAEKSNSGKFSLGVFAKSKINIRLNNILLNYQLKSKTNGKIAVSKFLINGLNFESPSAFEIASNISMTDELKATTSFDLLTIGQIHLNEFVTNGNIPVDAVIKINQFNKTGLSLKVPELSTTMNFVAKKNGDIDGKFETSFENQNKVSGKFNVASAIELKDFNADINLKDIHTMLGLDNSIDMSKSKLKILGQVSVDNEKKIIPQFSYEISPAVATSMEGVSIQTTSEGEYKGDEFKAKIINKVMDGVALVTINGKHNLNDKFDLKTLRPFEIKVSANDIKLTEKFIQQKLWGKKKENEVTPPSNNGVNANSAESSNPTLIASVVDLSWSAISVAGQDFQGKGRITTGLNNVVFENIGFKFSKGTGKLNQIVTMKKTSNDSKFSLEVSNLNLEAFKSFLPPFVENFSGEFSGKVTGNATMFKTQKPVKYDINTDLSIKKGEIKKLNISDYINPVVTSIPVVKDIYKGDKELKINGNFETLTLKGNFNESKYTLNQFNFLGIGSKVELQGSGYISPLETGDSLLDVDFNDNTGKISQPLQKYTGTKTLPLKLSGKGFSLKPDINFTVSKLAKGALKTKGEEKLKEAAQKAADKLLNGKVKEIIKSDETKEKVNKLLKGLFK